MNHRRIPLTLLTTLTFIVVAEAQNIPSAPRLVVSIAIDQLRSDYLEAFAPLYGEGGFKRLMTEGRVYANVSYPFAPIDRASAVATVATGTTPYYHTIVGAQWLNKKTLRPVACTDDAKYNGLQTTTGSSAANLSTSTVGDELKVSTNGRAVVYSIAPFADAAVFAAGHAADGALWIDDDNGYWCSSTYYYKALPAWVTAYNSLHAPAKSIDGKEWRPSSALVGNFSYFMGGGVKEPFRHKFSGTRRLRQYKASALVNTDVTDIATQCVNSCGMGIDAVTDLLCLTYYAGTFDHQTVAQSQMELQDTYVRLDAELSRLITSLERKAGCGNVLFVVTGTGYCDEDQSDYARYNIPTGTFYINRAANLLNMYFGGLYGSGRYVDTCFGSQIYLNHKTFEDKHISFAEGTSRAVEMLSQMAGVRDVYTAQQLLSSGANPYIRRNRNGFCVDRNGDILIEVAPGWRLVNEDNTYSHISRASYIQIPIIIFGNGIKAERIAEAVTADRIAPTIAKAIRIRAPNACASEPLF